jgi:hypothetical protein
MGLKYQIKRKIVKSAMKKRAKKFKFNETDGDNFNNSYYFTATDKNGERLFFRVGYRGNGEKEVWAVFIDKNGTEYVNKESLATAGCFSFNYNGGDFQMDGVFTPIAPEYEFTRDSDPAIFANLLARLKWTKGFDEEFKKIQQTHIEQMGKITANIKIDGKTVAFEGVGIRDHSWGRRVWSDMHSHQWFIVAFDDGGCLCAASVNGLYAGYYIKDGIVRNAVDVKYNDDNKEFKITLRNGKTLHEMVGQYTIKYSVPFDFENGNYHIDEGVADFVMNGVKGYGITEFGRNTHENI